MPHFITREYRKAWRPAYHNSAEEYDQPWYVCSCGWECRDFAHPENHSRIAILEHQVQGMMEDMYPGENEHESV